VAFSELFSLNHEEEPSPITFSIGITNDVHGAGSTTTARLLTEIFHFEYSDPGDVTRQMAVDADFAQGLEDDQGVLHYEREVVTRHPQIDAQIDREVITQAARGNCVLEGNAAVILAKAGLIPNKEGNLSPLESLPPIFTVLLTCQERVAAQRVLLRKELRRRNIDPSTVSPETRQVIIDGLNEEQVNRQMNISRQRKKTTRQNWDRLYGLSKLEKGEGAFDLPPIDTTNLTPEQVVSQIIIALKDKSLISQEKAQEALAYLSSRSQNPH